MLNKKRKKGKTKVEKKEKILRKLVVRKEDKGFDVVECWLVDDTLNNEFLGFFPFGNDSLPGVSINVHHFKITPPTIIYCPFSNIDKDGIKKIITQYNNFDTKVPIFAIPEDSHNANHITPRKLK